MSERTARRRCAASTAGFAIGRRGRPPKSTSPPLRRIPKPLHLSRHSKFRGGEGSIRRTSSEPILWTVRLIPDGDEGRGSSSAIGDEALLLPRPHTCYDIFLTSPSSIPAKDPGEEVKVVVSVTVEGSPGPVRAMVKLGASVKEAIAVVVDRYSREGRSPRLNLRAADGFELHYSHFCLQSLDKSNKIGEVGGRSFYLRTKSSKDEGSDTTARGREAELVSNTPPAVVPHQLFLSFVVRKLNKLGRRTRKFWKVVLCIACG